MKLLKNQKGQTATEYMLIIGVVVVGLLIAAQQFVPKFKTAVETIGGYVETCVTTGKCKFQNDSGT